MKLSNNRIIKTDTGTFHRAMETKYHIYFVKFDGDNRQVLMYDRKMTLIKKGAEAIEAFNEDLKSPLNFWKSDLLKLNLVVSK